MFRLASVMACMCGLLLTQTAPTVPTAPANYRQKSRTFHTADEFKRLAPGVRLHRTVEMSAEMTLRRAVASFPISQFTVIAAESNSVTWIGTPQGAVRLSVDVRGGSLTKEFFAGRRWLPDDRVVGIGFDRRRRATRRSRSRQ
jgi:hypothetical protein